MKIIFLDVDGVLNSSSTRNNWALNEHGKETRLIGMAPELVGRLNDLLDRSGAQLVLSSTWRVMGGLSNTILNLNHAGFRHADRFIGQTPDCATPRGDGWFTATERGHEIHEWLEEWKGDPIESFVILDDSSDMAHLMPRLAKCDWRTGLTDKVVARALAMLSESVTLAQFIPKVSMDDPEAA